MENDPSFSQKKLGIGRKISQERSGGGVQKIGKNKKSLDSKTGAYWGGGRSENQNP